MKGAPASFVGAEHRALLQPAVEHEAAAFVATSHELDEAPARHEQRRGDRDP